MANLAPCLSNEPRKRRGVAISHCHLGEEKVLSWFDTLAFSVVSRTLGLFQNKQEKAGGSCPEWMPRTPKFIQKSRGQWIETRPLK